MVRSGEPFSPSESATRRFLGEVLDQGLSVLQARAEEALHVPAESRPTKLLMSAAPLRQRRSAVAKTASLFTEAGNDSLSDGSDGGESLLKAPALHLQFCGLPARVGEVLLMGGKGVAEF